MKKSSTDELPFVKTKQTKKGTNMKKTIILTVISTLAVIGVLVATFLMGVRYQKNYDRGIQTQVNAQVSKLK